MTQTGTLLGPLERTGGLWRHGSGYLRLTLRDPYEDWVARFSRHPRHYPATGILLFGELVKRLLDESRAHLLGDPALLDRVVGRLATERLRGRHATQDAVTRALAPEDPAHADPASADPAPADPAPADPAPGKQSPEK